MGLSQLTFTCTNLTVIHGWRRHGWAAVFLSGKVCVLMCSQKAGYVSYTATPPAKIFTFPLAK